MRIYNWWHVHVANPCIRCDSGPHFAPKISLGSKSEQEDSILEEYLRKSSKIGDGIGAGIVGPRLAAFIQAEVY